MKPNHQGPKRAKYNCRPRSGFRTKLTDADIGELTAKLVDIVSSNAGETQVKAASCRLSRAVITSHSQGLISAKQAADDLASSVEILEDADYRQWEAIVPEALMRFHARRDHYSDAEDSSNARLFSLAQHLLEEVEAYETGNVEPTPPHHTWSAGLAWAACARVTDIFDNRDDALGYARIALGLTWTRHERMYGLSLEVMRRIFFERGQTVLAAALPRVVRGDLGRDLIQEHWILATTLWGV